MKHSYFISLCSLIMGAKKKIGRPPSKVTREIYLERHFQKAVLFSLLDEDIEEHIGRRVQGLESEDNVDLLFGKTSHMVEMVKGKSEWEILRLGVQSGVNITFSALRKVLEQINYHTNASNLVEQQLELAETIAKEPGFEDYLQKVTRLLPNDLLRKVRKPKFSKSEIVQFLITVKTAPTPYLEGVAEELSKTPEEIRQLISEAKRQGRRIDVGKHKGKEVIVLD